MRARGRRCGRRVQVQLCHGPVRRRHHHRSARAALVQLGPAPGRGLSDAAVLNFARSQLLVEVGRFAANAPAND
jgi:hypothetical protein